AAPTGASHARERLPLQGPLVVAGRPLAGGLGRRWLPLAPGQTVVAGPAWG
ncbi:hypothetical protein B296_00056542, partial [Ensete ventricosum]